MAVWSDGWIVKNLGGRPTQEPKTKSLKIRLSESQYSKVEDSADAQGISKVDVIRNLIDTM